MGSSPGHCMNKGGLNQLAALRKLLTGLIPSNRFYSRKLAGVDVERATESIEAFIRLVPFTRKQELVDDQRRNPPYGTNLTYPLECYSRFSRTSATTGRPMVCLDRAEDWNWMLDNWRRVFKAAGVSEDDHVFFAFSFGPFLGFWTAFEAATHLGALSVPGGGLSSTARLRMIIDYGISVLCSTPTYALRLGEVARAQGIDLAAGKVKTIIVAGEPGGSVSAVRRRVAELWPGARLFDHYGMTEVGPVAYEDPAHGCRLKLIDSSYFAEVVDRNGEDRIMLGETGELVLTTLGRMGSPLLRYRTGDLVRPILAGSSGEIAFEGGIFGRVDDLVHVRGVNLYPSAVDEVIRSFSEVLEYRVEVGSKGAMREISIQLEVADGSPWDEIERRVAASLRDVFSLRFEVNVVAPETLPRFELKARRWTKV